MAEKKRSPLGEQGAKALEKWRSERTPEELHAQRSAAARGSVARRYRYKTMREIARQILETEIQDEEKREILAKAGLDPTYSSAILHAVSAVASQGDVEASRFLRDTVGEKPTDSYAMSIENKPVKSMDLSKLSDEQLQALADREDQ